MKPTVTLLIQRLLLMVALSIASISFTSAAYAATGDSRAWALDDRGLDLADGQWYGYGGTSLAQCQVKANAAGVDFIAHTPQIYGGYCKVLKPGTVPNLGTNQGYGYQLYSLKTKASRPSDKGRDLASSNGYGNTSYDECAHLAQQTGVVYFAYSPDVYGGYCKVQKPHERDQALNAAYHQGYGYKLYEAPFARCEEKVQWMRNHAFGTSQGKSHYFNYGVLPSNGASILRYLSEVETWCAPGNRENLALGKPTAQSSTGWGGVSSRAVDGNTDGNYGASSVTHGQAEFLPYWEVDLGDMYQIDEIVIYNRTDCCNDRLRNLGIVYLDENKQVVMPTTSPSAMYPHMRQLQHYYDGRRVISVRNHPAARTVRIHSNGYLDGRQTYLSLAEVKVFGKPLLNSGAKVALRVPSHRKFVGGETRQEAASGLTGVRDAQLMSSLGKESVFVIESLGTGRIKYGDRVGFRTLDGNYLAAHPVSQFPEGPVSVSGPQLGGWETFTVERPANVPAHKLYIDAGTPFGLRGAHGKTVTAMPDGSIVNVTTHILGWETFMMSELTESAEGKAQREAREKALNDAVALGLLDEASDAGVHPSNFGVSLGASASAGASAGSYNKDAVVKAYASAGANAEASVTVGLGDAGEITTSIGAGANASADAIACANLRECVGAYSTAKASVGVGGEVAADLNSDAGKLNLCMGSMAEAGIEAEGGAIVNGEGAQAGAGFEAGAAVTHEMCAGITGRYGGVGGKAGVSFGPSVSGDIQMSFNFDGCTWSTTVEGEARVLVGVEFEGEVAINFCAVGEAIAELASDLWYDAMGGKRIEEWTVGAASDVAQWTKGAANDMADFVVDDVGGWTVTAAHDVADGLETATYAVGDWFEGGALDVADFSVLAANQVADWTSTAAVDMADWTVGAANDVAGFFEDDVAGFFSNDVANFFEDDVAGFFADDVGGAFASLGYGIGDAAEEVWDTINPFNW